jgi:acetyl esterase/lipase
MLFFSLFALYITRKEKRSFRSWMSEKLLRYNVKKGWFHASVDTQQFLEEQRKKNEIPYQFPVALKLLCEVKTLTLGAIPSIILHERGPQKPVHILYLHGGAYVEHPILPHWLFLDRINNLIQGTITVPIYPKAPVHTVMETIDPLIDLYRNIRQQHKVHKVIIMGDSAGGGLALALAQELVLRGEVMPKELILISPWLDIGLRNGDIDQLEPKDPMLNRQHLQVMGDAWAGSLPKEDRRVSPINGPMEHLPPLSLFIGTHEILLADARKFRILCTRSGSPITYREYPKMNHDFPLFPIPEAKQAIREIVAIINR